ncbi:MAG: GNAT family N-acetyltransferase [Saccharospirillaceae bacterium]|nr:GNAT family N-acetyltransferase [Saccharospirillaceae bacterium]
MFNIIQIDYNNQQQNEDLLYLLNEYACDEMGGGEPLSEFCKQNLIKNLTNNQSAVSFILYDQQKPIGFSNCFLGFSTFICRPLMNIHDFAVLDGYRGKKLSQLLLTHIEQYAKIKDCCKITLEVLENNHAAKKAYQNYGFAGYELLEKSGVAMFWQKKLEDKKQ